MRKKFTEKDLARAYAQGKYDGTVATIRRVVFESESQSKRRRKPRRRISRTRKVAAKAKS